jgi:hypothetical protein
MTEFLERKVLAERLPDFVEPFARMTMRFSQQIASVGLAMCGKGGVRLAARLAHTDQPSDDPAPHHGSA